MLRELIDNAKEEGDTSLNEAIQEVLGDLDDSLLCNLWNEYASRRGWEEPVMPNDPAELEGFFETVSDALRAAQHGVYSVYDDWVMYTDLGRLISSDSVADLIDMDQLAEWIEEDCKGGILV